MDLDYDQVVELDEKVVPLALKFKDTFDYSLIAEIHQLLKPITTSEAKKLVRDSGWTTDLVEDMVQEAYIKLVWAVWAFNDSRNPTFISYWRTAIRNHLISLYQKQWRHRTLNTDEPQLNGHTEAAVTFIQELKTKYLEEFSTWDNSRSSDIAKAVLLERILIVPEQQTLQKELSKRFDITQSQISHWEKWIRSKIATENSWFEI